MSSPYGIVRRHEILIHDEQSEFLRAWMRKQNPDNFKLLGAQNSEEFPGYQVATIETKYNAQDFTYFLEKQTAFLFSFVSPNK